MTALARPERDLWWVISGDQDAARYSRRTGWPVNQDALSLYRLRWSLDDIAEFLSEFRAPHQQTADTLVSWTALKDTLEAIRKSLSSRRLVAFDGPIAQGIQRPPLVEVRPTHGEVVVCVLRRDQCLLRALQGGVGVTLLDQFRPREIAEVD